MQETTSVRVKPCRHGLFGYFTNDTYIGRAMDEFGEYSEIELSLLTRLVNTNACVVEVGANIGTHTVPLANRVGMGGRVFAFEAQRVIFNMMAGNCAFNGCLNVFAEHVALGDRAGWIGVPPVDYTREGNFGAVELAADKPQGENVRLAMLDSYMLTPQLIKIDVEGMEQAVIEGAVKTIKRSRPFLYVENDRPAKSERLIHAIQKLGYDMWWHLPPLFNPDNMQGIKKSPWPGVISINMLCAPKEREMKVEGATRITEPVKGPPIGAKQ